MAVLGHHTVATNLLLKTKYGFHGTIAHAVSGSSINVFTITAEIHARSLAIFLLSMCGQTHEFKIHATCQRARAGNSTICYHNKQIDVSF